MPRKRRHLLAPITLLTALALSGCGASKTADKATSAVRNVADPVAQASTNTRDAGSATVTLSGSVKAGSSDVQISGSGPIDFKRRRGAFDVGVTIPGQGSVKLSEIIDGTVLYMRSPTFSALLGGKTWIKLDLSKAAKAAGVDLNQLSQLGGGSDPSQFLDALNRASDTTKLGSEQIGGVNTTHYRATIDLAKVAKDRGGDQAARARSSSCARRPASRRSRSRRGSTTRSAFGRSA